MSFRIRVRRRRAWGAVLTFGVVPAVLVAVLSILATTSLAVRAPAHVYNYDPLRTSTTSAPSVMYVRATSNPTPSGSTGAVGVASPGFSAAEEGSSIDQALSGLRAGRSPNVYEVDTPEQMQELFDQLSQGGQRIDNNYPGDLVRLPDDSTVGLRGASKSGGPTIDITQPGQPPIKVHLP